MLHSTASHLAFAKYSAALRIDDILCNCVHDGLPRHVHALYLVAVPFWSRQESHRQLETRVKTLAAEREAFLECILL